MRIRPAAINVLLVLLLATLTTGCGKGPDKRIDPSAENTLRIGNSSEPETLDPHLAESQDAMNIISAIFENLVRSNMEDLTIVPAAAESWEASDGGSTYIFKLRPNLKWSNGDPLTAADFVYAYQRMLQPGFPMVYVSFLYPILNARSFREGELTDFDQVGVHALSEDVVEFRLEYATPYFLENMAQMEWLPVHQATIEAHETAANPRASRWTRPDNFVGNGPYVISRWEPNKLVEVVRNPHYWNDAQTRIDSIQFLPIADPSVEERMFRAGEVDITSNIPFAKIQTYRRDNPALIRVVPERRVSFCDFNVEKPPFDDVRVRKAFAMSIDREIIVTRVLRGNQQPAYNFFFPDSAGYTSTAAFQYDPGEAQKLLKEAGYPNGEGLPEIEFLLGSAETSALIAEVMQQMWRDTLGVTVKLRTTEQKVWLRNYDEGDYQITFGNWGGNRDPAGWLELYESNNSVNWSNYASPEFDKFLDEGRRANSLEASNRAYDRAENILINDAPLIPVFFNTAAFLVDPRVKGFYTNDFRHTVFHKLWLENE